MYVKGFLLRNSYWFIDFLKGSPIRKQYKEIRIIQNNVPTGAALREQNLKNLLHFACLHTPLYKGINPSALAHFPVVNKLLLTEKYDQVRIGIKHIPGQKGDVFIQRTSGSTGTPFAVPQDTRKRNRRVAELKYFGKEIGFNSHDKLIHLRVWTKYHSKSKRQMDRENILPFDISNLSKARLAALCAMINKEKGMTIRSYASALDLLAQYVREHKIKFPSLKLCIATSETLQETTRSLVKQYLGCKVVSQYANEESGYLAQELPGGETSHFYLNTATYYWEFLKLDRDEAAQEGELSRIVLTDMYNYAFPMIRYDTGDLAVWERPDQYSHGYPVITQLYGRKNDLVYNTLGDPISPMLFARILKNFPEIQQWQFIQKTEHAYVLNLVSKQTLKAEDELKEALLSHLGSEANLALAYIDGIPVLSSGKRKCVVNEQSK